jgi:hypothetical protein
MIILIAIVLVPICIIGYSFYIVNKWYKRGYRETYELFHNGHLRCVENPDYVYHSCNENKYYHRGAYQAYKEINNLNN